MQTVKFSGASDDLIHVDGFDDKYDEVSGRGSGPHVGTFSIAADGHQIEVFALYSGTWQFAVGVGDDSEALPDWPMTRTWGDECPYSETLTLEVPDGATIERVK